MTLRLGNQTCLGYNARMPENVGIDARPLVDALIAEALRRRASDIHVEPTAAGYEVRLRLDGLLETIATHDVSTGRSLVLRLMVLAQLLTYRLDIPQEGAIRLPLETTGTLDLRLAVMPTLHGLRAAVRLPADLLQPKTLDALGLPDDALRGLHRFAAADAGMLLLVGPAGSGKTTTIYALLGHIAAVSPGMSIITLEDPVERALSGVTQIEVSPFGELTYERALRSILRQDPQVLMLGEIRDAATASLAVQAALSGHRLICTLHAASPAGAIARLLEMGLEPYQINSALHGVLAQRLVRRKSGDAYHGRIPLAEYVEWTDALRAAVLRRADAATLRGVYERPPHRTLRMGAADMVARGLTDAAEVQRVIGSET